jgi:flagellar biosynthesis protein FlhB
MAGLMQLTAVGLAGQLAFAWEALTSLMVQLAAGMIIIALFDWPVQWLRRQRRLRMSLQEVKDENKEQEGSPEARAAVAAASARSPWARSARPCARRNSSSPTRRISRWR